MEARYAREIALKKKDELNKDKLNSILQQIRLHSESGKMQVVVEGDIDSEIREKLTAMGYSITRDVQLPKPYGADTPSYTIRW